MLKKFTLDGSERENIGSLVVGGPIISTNNSGNSIFWIIHRGYIYYTYSASASIGSEDTYYLNNSNYIFRMSLEGKEEPECIMKLPYISHCSLKGIGSYVYITTWDMNYLSRNLYRYNTETGKLERFESLGDNIMDCTEKDGLNGLQDITRFYVMDWNYNIIANVELEESNGYRSWLGTDNNCIYISRIRTDEYRKKRKQ